MLRHHPSIALWCGNNECNWEFCDIWNPDKTEPLEVGGQKLYNQLLPDLCHQLDPRRPYWPSSPCGGESPNSELEGDCHWWWQFFMHPDINRRIRHEVFDECRARFVSEYGVIGPCHLDSIQEYLSPEEMHPGTPAWQMHTNTFEKETVPAAIRLHYADPEGLTVAEYVVYGQMFQAIIHGRALEALRFRKHDPVDDCQGALIWSYSDCWGETGWSILDYYLRRKASYYWFRRANAPVKVIVRLRPLADASLAYASGDDHFITRIVNDTLHDFSGVVDFGWWKLDGSQKDVETKEVVVRANGVLEVAVSPLHRHDSGNDLPDVAREPHEWLYAAVLSQPDGEAIDQSIWPLLPHRELALASPEIKVTSITGDGLVVTSPVYCHGVHTEDHGRELVSDNWFDLLPGVSKQIRFAEGIQPRPIKFMAITKGRFDLHDRIDQP
jgi:beta-mannosidase